jgi:hypothetical protein
MECFLKRNLESDILISAQDNAASILHNRSQQKKQSGDGR